MIVAHRHASKPRTLDIHLDENVSFSDIGLNETVTKGLFKAGFEKPSPVQLSAIPVGRCGLGLSYFYLLASLSIGYVDLQTFLHSHL